MHTASGLLALILLLNKQIIYNCYIYICSVGSIYILKQMMMHVDLVHFN